MSATNRQDYTVMRGLSLACLTKPQATTNVRYGVRYSATQLEEPQVTSSFLLLATKQETVHINMQRVMQ